MHAAAPFTYVIRSSIYLACGGSELHQHPASTSAVSAGFWAGPAGAKELATVMTTSDGTVDASPTADPSWTYHPPECYSTSIFRDVEGQGLELYLGAPRLPCPRDRLT